MAARGGPDDDHGRSRYTSRRERSPSLVRWLAVLLVAVGLVAVAWVAFNRYVPDLTDPTQVALMPLFGLTNVAAAGIVSILVGLLIYLYANLAGV